MPYPGFDDDRDYLVNKFRHPELDPATGLDNAALKTAIIQLADELEGQPHAVVKARAFALVCEKMQIDVDPHDDFPAFACYDRNDRPLRVLMDRWNAEFDRKFLPDVQPVIDARNDNLFLPTLRFVHCKMPMFSGNFSILLPPIDSFLTFEACLISDLLSFK